ncbi:MAG: SpaA isopeptide-forming pilin-related protein, partial [Chloroflexota bacterium]
MRRSTPFLLSSWMLALVLVLATFVGGVTASSIPAPAGAAAGARAAAATGLLCIVKFNDLDGDGKKGTAEPTLGGWVFTIEYAGGGVAGMITTSAAAARTCAEMPAGAYKVTETPQAGWTQTAPTPVGPQTVTIVSGQTTTLTFGNSQAKTGTLCIVKYNDLDGDGLKGATEPTLAGWVFRITDAGGAVVGTITTTAAAARTCIDLAVGTYRVTETFQAGWIQTTPTPAGPQTVTIVAGQTTTLTFGNRETKTGMLCVTKFNDLDGDGLKGATEPTLSGWVFTITDAAGAVVGTMTTATSATGTEASIDLPAGTYTVTETQQAGWTPTIPVGGTQAETVVADETTTVTFGNRQTKTGTLCVVKFNDLDGDGKQGTTEPTLGGWVFTITDVAGNIVGTITTTATAA